MPTAAPLVWRGSARESGSSIDYIDVVVHIFTTTARDFYRLETLWGDVPRLDVPTEG